MMFNGRKEYFFVLFFSFLSTIFLQCCAAMRSFMACARSSLLTSSNSTGCMAHQLRLQTIHVRIANRMKAERFHATRYLIPTRLDSAAPHIAAEWDFEKNPMFVYPKIIGVGSLKTVWWKCSACGSSYEASVEARALRGQGCSDCKERSAQPNRSKKRIRKCSSTKKKGSREKGTSSPVLAGEIDVHLKPKRPTTQR